jgi:hypothetical protein
MKKIDFKVVFQLLWIFFMAGGLIVLARILSPNGIPDDNPIPLLDRRLGDIIVQDIFPTLLVIGIAIGLVVWENKRIHRCIYCKDKRKGQKIYVSGSGDYHRDCIKEINESRQNSLTT